MSRKPATIAFWRGRLPHWEVEDGRYFVTVHLAGAIPEQGQHRIHAMAKELELIVRSDEPARLRLQRRIYLEMESWLDRTEYVSHLQVPEVGEMVMEAVEHRHGLVWNVIEYVIMPSHLHLFFETREPGLKKSLEQFKRWTGHEALKLMNSEGETRFWQDEWFDHWSRSDEEDEKIITYIRRNPVKAGLAHKYEAWPYCSWSRRERSQV